MSTLQMDGFLICMRGLIMPIGTIFIVKPIL